MLLYKALSAFIFSGNGFLFSVAQACAGSRIIIARIINTLRGSSFICCINFSFDLIDAFTLLIKPRKFAGLKCSPPDKSGVSELMLQVKM